jgi:membrane protease YdiL (CAAX protease family)
MSRSDPPNPPARPVTGVEIVCVFLMQMLCYSLCHVVLESADFFAWFYGADALAADPFARDRQGLWATAIAAPFLVASALTFLAAGVGVPLEAVGLTTRNLGRNVLAGLLFAFIFVPGSLCIQQLALMALEAAGSAPVEHRFTQLRATGLLPAEWGLLVFTAVVVAPVWEEILFRGLIQPWVMRNGRRGALVALGLAALLAGYGVVSGWPAAPTPRQIAVKLAPLWVLTPLVAVYFLVERRGAAWGGLFASAVLFAWIHVAAWPSPVPLVWLALGLGWLAWRGRSLAGAVVLHAVFNAVACVALWYAPNVENDTIPIPPASVSLPGEPP